MEKEQTSKPKDLWEGCLDTITFEELGEWIKRNKHVTWHHGSWGRMSEPGAKRGKYLRFNLDTRDMRIFSLHLEGMGDPITIDFRQKGEGNLLNELDRILAKDVLPTS